MIIHILKLKKVGGLSWNLSEAIHLTIMISIMFQIRDSTIKMVDPSKQAK